VLRRQPRFEVGEVFLDRGRLVLALGGRQDLHATRKATSRLAEQLGREADRYVRIQRADGSFLQGEVLDVTPTDLRLFNSDTREEIRVSVLELLAVDVLRPRRGREWMVAIGAIPVATVFVIAYSQMPWVRPREGVDLLIGLAIFAVVVAAVASTPKLRDRLVSWFTQWQRLYSAPDEPV
jgi:hypothetical protein